MELLANMGFVHRDIKVQNICYDEQRDQFSFIDFGLAVNLYDHDRNHKPQEYVRFSEGNFVFGSDAFYEFKKIGRKDELESLFYVMQFLK